MTDHRDPKTAAQAEAIAPLRSFLAENDILKSINSEQIPILPNGVMWTGIWLCRCGLRLAELGLAMGANKPRDEPRLAAWADDDEPLDDAGLAVEIKVARDPNGGHRVWVHTNGRLELRVCEADLHLDGVKLVEE